MKESSCSTKTKMKMALALKELIETTPFEKITVSDITDKCDIHRQTFYYHFQDKYELLEWYLNRAFLQPLIEGFSFENMYENFNRFASTIYDNKAFYISVFNINTNNLLNFIEKLIDDKVYPIVKDISRTRRLSEAGADENRLFATFFGYGLFGIIVNWVKDGMNVSPDELTRKFIAMVETIKEIQLDSKLEQNRI